MPLINPFAANDKYVSPSKTIISLANNKYVFCFLALPFWSYFFIWRYFYTVKCKSYNDANYDIINKLHTL